MSLLEQLSAEAGAAAEGAARSVVGIGGWRGGSGVVFAEGRVLTSAHVLRREETTVVLPGGDRVAGRAVGVDVDGDLAVLDAPTAGVVPMAWAEQAPALGSCVFALARLGDGELRLTFGIVSALGRSFRGPRGRRISGTLEHTATVARGSAGGPLVDRGGRLLGLNTARLDGGLVLALAAGPELRARAEALARGEAPARRSLGVAVAPPRAARRMRRAVGLEEREGVLVRRVEEAGPADGAGIRQGDLIASAGGLPVDSVDALHAALDRVPTGESLSLTLVRGDEERAVEVRFTETAATP